MRADLLTHPKVVRISSALKADRLRTVGGLMAVWCLFDAHSVDGILDGYTRDALDDLIGWPGFAGAMVSIGWLEDDGDSLSTPRFDEHNGQSAKRRATETERKRMARAAEELSASEADEKRSREEKKREEKKEQEIPPSGERGKPRPTKKAPASFVVSSAMRQWAATDAAGIDIDSETAKFRDHTFGSSCIDWPGRWRNWMRKALELRPRMNGAHVNKQEALEASNRAVGDRWLAEQERNDAAH
jgi:hypothetical protein